jgi:4-aminobutyrate aminotransferase-like enzyme
MSDKAKSHLFYMSTARRPRLARASGIYLWDVDGKRYIDASSGPMVSNIGHSNPRVLAVNPQPQPKLLEREKERQALALWFRQRG